LFIRNNRPTLPPEATSGFTRGNGGGQYAITVDEDLDPNDGYVPHMLRLYQDDVPNVSGTFFPGFTFHFFGPGSKGGSFPYEPAADEDVAIASVEVRGSGTVTFYGETATITRQVGTVPLFLWEHISVTRDSVDGDGKRLGDIREVVVIGIVKDGDGTSFDVRPIGVNVAREQDPLPTNVIANDDSAKVSQRQSPRSVEFNWLQNDVDLDADPITLVGHTQPVHGSVEMRSSGFATYRPTAGYVGRDSFEYTITDGKGNSRRQRPGRIRVPPGNRGPAAAR
jgi:hypothetical protein